MSTELTSVELFDALSRAGLSDRATARRIIDATLAVLGERLTADESAALARCLAPPLAALVRQSEYSGEIDSAELYERIRRRAQVSAGLAREQAQVVLSELGRVAPEEITARVARALPHDLAELFEPRAAGEPPPPRVAGGRSLADGRPGSRRPVSEAAPPSAQTHSVVREDNPHGDTKLSSGQPGPVRPITDGWREP